MIAKVAAPYSEYINDCENKVFDEFMQASSSCTSNTSKLTITNAKLMMLTLFKRLRDSDLSKYCLRHSAAIGDAELLHKYACHHSNGQLHGKAVNVN
ncbi:CLUMA_CG003337, isoform A [Clunio marinus]|uniref:CLUMA_CG003337, isoform A n=1 Tax=Clunio marinus TaxID=568069 RepID=A0A1J1HNB4_9DIPT|nr:CLUMA_CG003337, isoform A [Clunio marinus]